MKKLFIRHLILLVFCFLLFSRFYAQSTNKYKVTIKVDQLQSKADAKPLIGLFRKIYNKLVYFNDSSNIFTLYANTIIQETEINNKLDSLGYTLLNLTYTPVQTTAGNPSTTGNSTERTTNNGYLPFESIKDQSSDAYINAKNQWIKQHKITYNQYIEKQTLSPEQVAEKAEKDNH